MGTQEERRGKRKKEGSVSANARLCDVEEGLGGGAVVVVVVVVSGGGGVILRVLQGRESLAQQESRAQVPKGETWKQKPAGQRGTCLLGC